MKCNQYITWVIIIVYFYNYKCLYKLLKKKITLKLIINTFFLFVGVDKWQDKISCGFDRLVAFASTELEKRRRSTEGSVSCNTSPDSGIGPCENVNRENRRVINGPPQLYHTKLSPCRDSPPILEPPFATPTTPSLSPSTSPPPTLLPLDGPYSPVTINSPPALQPKYQRPTSSDHHHFKKKFYHHKGKFKPKGKEWDWHHVPDTQQPWC